MTLSVSLTVGQAIRRVRQTAQKGDIFYLYVVDEAQALAGVVSIRNLLLAQDDEPLPHLIVRNPVHLRATDSVQDAYAVFAKSRFLSLPVVDELGKILGVVHAHELVGDYGSNREALFEERSRGQLFELLGIKAGDESKNALGVAMARLPWLLVNVIGGTISASIIHKWGDRLDNYLLYLAFIPVLLIVAESVGMQAASIAIANLNRGASRLKSRSVLGKEFAVALFLGAGCGTLLSVPIYFWFGSAGVALSIGLTMVLGAVWVSVLGNLIPAIIHHLSLDPSVSAGPLVLALADLTTLILFLSVAFSLTAFV